MRVICLTLAAFCSCAVATAEDFEYTPFDDFEDCSPWIRGDPNTEMDQDETRVAPGTEIVHEGEQSLAFMVRVDWTEKEGQQYARGWPMVTRDLDPPVDWREYDRVFLWLYTRTEDPLPADRVLRVGFFGEGAQAKGGPWYTINGIAPNEWTRISVPLDPSRDWSAVNRIAFYVAEAWYQDGDRVDFFIDDMQLARRTSPVFLSASAASRVPDRKTLTVQVQLEGKPDPLEHSVECTMINLAGVEQRRLRWRLKQQHEAFTMPLEGVPAGGHIARIELLDGDSEVLDSREQYFRSLEPGKRSYLSLISFYSSTEWQRNDLENAAVLNDSAYAGVAFPFWHGYSTDPVEDWGDLKPKLDHAKEIVQIDMWPWVFTNRFIGAPEGARGHAGSHADDVEYFRRIPILDLDNETGARADLMKMFRLSVRAAKYWGAPGIVVDLESYNNYSAYFIKYVAQERGESYAETIRKCELVGEDIAKIVEEEYPECIIWTLFSRLEAQHEMSGSGAVHTVPGYITLGYLRYAKEHDLPTKYLCGGETTPGYYNPSVEALRTKILERDRDMAPYLRQFPDHFFLAGTISPYHDFDINTGFMKDRPGENPQIRDLDDHKPLFQQLFAAYDWNWIYASGAAKTEPYDIEKNAMYADVLEEALSAAAEE